MDENIDWSTLGLKFVLVLIIVAVCGLAIWGLLRLNGFIFKRIQKKHQGLHLLFFQRVSSALILVGGVILIVSFFNGLDSVWQTLLGGTAIITAVLSFAAQDVIKDILAGLMISLHKPFEIGNRIELEDGTIGIVKDMTMRHVVLLGLDTQYFVIPNSQINTKKIRNFSYHLEYRSADFNFHIGYDSDVEKAMSVIKEAIVSSPFSFPGKKMPNGSKYADIYFMAYEQSSLRLSTTVYFKPETTSEVLISDINLRVNKALKDSGIEIPYSYINIIQKRENAATENDSI